MCSDKWTSDKQNVFSDWMGKRAFDWVLVMEATVAKLFDGSDESIAVLTSLISDGQMVEGRKEMPTPKLDADIQDSRVVEKALARTFYAFAIPALWTVSGHFPFIVDSGYPCGTIDPITKYMDKGSQGSTWECYKNKLYYLATLDGKGQVCHTECEEKGNCGPECVDGKFSMPPGLKSLNTASWGGLRYQDLIIG